MRRWVVTVDDRIVGQEPVWWSAELPRMRAVGPLTQEAAQAALVAVGDVNPFHRLLDLQRDAHWSLASGQSPEATISLVAAASEYMISALLAMLLWESGSTPESAAPHFLRTVPITSRLGRLGSYLGGSWDRGKGVVARWENEVARVRNEVLHAGTVATPQACEGALNAHFALVDAVSQQLGTARNRGRYPAAALAVLNEPGLQRQRSMTRRMREIAGETQTPTSLYRFQDWRWYLEQHAEGRTQATEDWHLWGVVTAIGDLYFFCVDDVENLAAPAMVGRELVEQTVAAIKSSDDAPLHRRSFGFQLPDSAISRRATPAGLWIDLHWILPSRECMAKPTFERLDDYETVARIALAD